MLGGTSGIGRATALAFARAGADVLVHGRSRRGAGEQLVDELRALGRRAELRLVDLADRAAGDRFADEAWELWGGLDVWVHFAGADVLTGDAARLSFDEKLDLLWSVDVAATIRLCRRVGRRMKAAGAGVVLAMGWDQADTGMEDDSGELFGATKGAVHAFTRALALSLAPEVRVNAVAPGWIKTAWGETAPEPWNARALRETPLARWGRPDDVARVALFLASPDAAFLTGQIVRVNGGAVRA